jgi:hypothetical protein
VGILLPRTYPSLPPPPATRRPYSARNRARHHDHPTTWVAHGNTNAMEIRVVIFLPRLRHPVMSESVHHGKSHVVEATR